MAQLKVDFLMRGCRSLKDKRARLGRLRDKFGRLTGVAVCESDHQDNHQVGQWTFVSCASSPKIVEQTLADIERFAAMSLDAEVVGLERTWLD